MEGGGEGVCSPQLIHVDILTSGFRKQLRHSRNNPVWVDTLSVNYCVFQAGSRTFSKAGKKKIIFSQEISG